METLALNPLQLKVAENIAEKIKEQDVWIEKQEKIIIDSVLGSSKTGYDLRQTVQATNSGKLTRDALVNYFNQLVGITYEDYCKVNDKVVKVVTTEQALLNAISNLIDSKFKDK